MIPTSPSAAVMAGSGAEGAHGALLVSQKPSCRPITWPAMRSAASAAMRPNTPRAIDSGLMAFWALVTSMAVS